MSSDSHSSPETPSKPARIPLPAGPSDAVRKTKTTQPEMEAWKTAGNVVQVPSSAPLPESAQLESVAPKSVPVNKHAEVNGQAPRENVQPNETEEDEEDEKDEEENGDSELGAFDWDEFESRYTVIIRKMDQDEDNVVREFDKFVDVSVSFLTVDLVILLTS